MLVLISTPFCVTVLYVLKVDGKNNQRQINRVDRFDCNVLMKKAPLLVMKFVSILESTQKPGQPS